jgi:hypothetical protein
MRLDDLAKALLSEKRTAGIPFQPPLRAYRFEMLVGSIRHPLEIQECELNNLNNFLAVRVWQCQTLHENFTLFNPQFNPHS